MFSYDVKGKILYLKRIFIFIVLDFLKGKLNMNFFQEKVKMLTLASFDVDYFVENLVSLLLILPDHLRSDK